MIRETVAGMQFETRTRKKIEKVSSGIKYQTAPPWFSKGFLNRDFKTTPSQKLRFRRPDCMYIHSSAYLIGYMDGKKESAHGESTIVIALEALNLQHAPTEVITFAKFFEHGIFFPLKLLLLPYYNVY